MSCTVMPVVNASATAPSPAATPLALGPDMTIAAASGWHEALANAFAAGAGDLSVDLGAVTDFDSSAVQLLLAARRSLAERGDALHVSAASTAVRDALAVFGLDALLQRPGAAA
jgi:anti-sigma B factor antagonist